MPTHEPLDPITHRTIDANGLRFHIAEAGPADAPLILCLHGFPESWYSWRHVLLGLSDRFRVVAPDMRGYGGTSKPETGYDLDSLSADVPALVRALGRERCFLVGHDWGGAVAYGAAMRYPEVVERLAVLNCPHPAAFKAALARNPRQWRRSWYMLFFQLPWLPERMLARQGGRAVAGSFKAMAGKKDAIPREDREVFRRAMLEPGAIRGGLAYYRAAFSGLFAGAIGRRNPLAMARPITAPTLIVWGDADPALGVELTYGMQRYFAGPYAIRYLRGIGHWTQQEAPVEVCEALRAHFA